ERRPPAAGLVALRALDLQHVRAEVGELHGGERTGEDAAEVEDPQAGQRAVAERAGGPSARFGGVHRSPSGSASTLSAKYSSSAARLALRLRSGSSSATWATSTSSSAMMPVSPRRGPAVSVCAVSMRWAGRAAGETLLSVIATAVTPSVRTACS